jgi:energy-coupling factor transporter ATP-binding protein EcfA2
MKLLRVHIISSKTCGDLLDDLDVELRSPFEDDSSFASFDPLCLIGANGAGKSQFLQILAEIFQSIFHACIPQEERVEGNPDLQFEIEYFIDLDGDRPPVRVRISRKVTKKQHPPILIEKKDEYDWIECDLTHPETHALLCPFCGDENFAALGSQGSRREALDHYLLKNSYPFAAANLRNLVPMGYKCNSQYKNTKDLLYKDDGTRRRSFDPYNHGTVVISLDNSQPFTGIRGELQEPLPQWQIDFGLNSEEIDTWNDVFYIRDRYSSMLNDEFKSWFEFFCQWCKRRINPQSDIALIAAIEQYAEDRASEGFGERAFLKAAVFRMLHIHCQQGNQRLIDFISYYVNLSI